MQGRYKHAADGPATPSARSAADPATLPAELATWTCIARLASRVLRELDRRLDLEHRTSLREFDVLINLGDGALRMTELANATLLSSGGLTRLAGRLEERGLIRRDPDPADARAFHAVLSERGQALLVELRRTHDAVVHELVGRHLDGDELELVRRSLARALAGPA